MGRAPPRAGWFLTAVLLATSVSEPASAQVLFRPVLGGLPADSGLAAGFELLRYRTLGPFDTRARVVGSLKLYEFAEVALESPPPATHDFFSEVRLRYRNYPEDDFWGLGPDSDETTRSNYRLEDVSVRAVAGLHFRNGFRVAAVVGLVETNIGPGRDREYPSTETRFTTSQAPGLELAPDYWQGGLLLDFDRRDNRDDTLSGHLSSFEWTRWNDRESGNFSFHRYAFEHRQFVPLTESRRIAARARLVVTDTDPGHVIPFYLQPSIGGTDTVRGFDQYRFRSGNSLLVNIEYRHVWLELLDIVGFADAGSVAARVSELDPGQFEGAAGLGARVKIGGRVFFGADVGFSREGIQLWFRSGQTF